MSLPGVLRFCLVGLCCLLSVGAAAQDDPNAQHITVESGALAAETRELAVPLEVGALRVFFNLQLSDDLNWTILTPAGKPLELSEPNISVIETKGKRTVAMWDPHPGLWRLRLSGTGRFSVAVTTQSELYVCCIQVFSRNLVHTLDKFETTRGARHQAQVYASSHNIDTIQFQLLNEQGQVIAPLKFRQSDLSNPYNFTLFLETPAQPFRIGASGRDTSGKQFQRVLPLLIHPLPEASPDREHPGVPPPEQRPTSEPLLHVIPPPLPPDWDKNAHSGEYKIARAQVGQWSDEPLLSAQGNPIGLRLKFSIRFPSEGAYQPYPQVQPERLGQTGALGLRVYRAMVTPTPDGLTNQQHLFLGARPIFKAGIVYDFTVDLVPNYAQYQEQKQAFCLQTRAYGQGELRERFAREVMSELRLRFRISIAGSTLDGRQPSLTENSYVPNEWYQSFRKEGAAECQ